MIYIHLSFHPSRVWESERMKKNLFAQKNNFGLHSMYLPKKFHNKIFQPADYADNVKNTDACTNLQEKKWVAGIGAPSYGKRFQSIVDFIIKSVYIFDRFYCTDGSSTNYNISKIFCQICII